MSILPVVLPDPTAAETALQRGRPLVYGSPLGGTPEVWNVDLPVPFMPAFEFATHAEAFAFAQDYAERMVAAYEERPCGHAARTTGCGGCDPGAIEFVIDEHGRRRAFDPAIDLQR